MTARGSWHRRTAWLPLGYLLAIEVVGLAHPVLPEWWWLGVHVLLLGASTNAILIWSAHFTLAVLRAPAPASRRGEAVRLAVLNVGVLAVLGGGTAGLGWVGVAGAGAVFAAIFAHLRWLWVRLRGALPAPYAGPVHYYVAASVALLSGIPVGAWMLVADGSLRPRLVLFHAHVNLLGWVTLTVLGTLLTLWPTVLRTRVVDGAVDAARTRFRFSAYESGRSFRSTSTRGRASRHSATPSSEALSTSSSLARRPPTAARIVPRSGPM